MIGGRYSLERQIGRGGMGAVWLGRDEVLGRAVAVKRVGLPPDGSSPDLLRAEREARIAASLNHPHVVAVFDLVHGDDSQWLVMEHVEGRSLAELVHQEGPMTPEQAGPLLAQVAQALAAAHAAGIVHRDVKPSNILLGADGVAKVSDFGIARAEADASLTQTGLVTGSPAYLAPEVASGRQATPASDVWSLGATLFHVLTGHPPYDAADDNVLGILYRIVNEPPPRLDGAGSLDAVLEATMTHQPSARWAMRDVAVALGRARGSTLAHALAPTRSGSTPEDGTRVLPQEEDRATAPRSTGPGARREGSGGRGGVAAPEPPGRSAGPGGPAGAGTGGTPPEPALDAAGASRPARSSARRRPGTAAVLVTVLIAGLVVAIVLLALRDDPQPNLGADDEPGGGGASTSASPSDPSPTSSDPAVTAEAMRAFASDYVSTASADPAAGFAMLTPDYQQRSPQYQEFWGAVSDPEILSVDADASSLVVSYTYRYRFRGSERTEAVSLQLVRDGDGFLIDGLA